MRTRRLKSPAVGYDSLFGVFVAEHIKVGKGRFDALGYRALSSARISDRDELRLGIERLLHGVFESLIGRWRIDGYIRHASEHRNIKNALVCLAIFADKSCAVDGDDHLLLLESGIVQKLIKAALEEVE